MKMNPDISILRLQVYLAHAGIASRRNSESLIANGRVKVNGIIVTDMGFKVKTTDLITFDDVVIELETEKRYLVLNKPSGYLSSMADPEGRPLAVDLIKSDFSERLYNVGRLDYYSTGLLLYTNDGNFAKIISHPSNEIKKEYLVESSQPILDETLVAFKQGIEIENVYYKATIIKRINSRSVTVELVEGKNREIRKVFAHFGVYLKVVKRIRIGPVLIGNLEEGKFRELAPEEIQLLLSSGEKR